MIYGIWSERGYEWGKNSFPGSFKKLSVSKLQILCESDFLKQRILLLSEKE